MSPPDDASVSTPGDAGAAEGLRRFRLECCVDTPAAARAAAADGADRLEVCASLDRDGLTPDSALLDAIQEAAPGLPWMVMLRPHDEGFVLDAATGARLRDELARVGDWLARHRPDGAGPAAAARGGVTRDGFVFGGLTAQGELPEQELGALCAAAADRPLTFHRAFDHIADPVDALPRLAALGFRRVLTSGRPGRAVDHLPRLAELAAAAQAATSQRKAGDALRLLPAGGIRPHNAARILAATGVDELHSSATRGWADLRGRADSRG